MSQSTLSERLLDEFSPRLDSALVLAIAADADSATGDRDQHEADARATLQALADATSEESYPPPDIASAHQDDMSEDTATTETASTLTSTTTDDEAVERAFQEWSTEDSQLDDDTAHKDLNAIYTENDDVNNASLDPISFLKNLFPKRERIELQVAYSDAEDDIQATIETLLTEDFLIREEEDYLLALQEEEANEANGKGDKGRRRRKPGKQTISLTSTPRGLHHREQATPSASEPEKSNVWIKTDSTILYLSQLLSVPPGTLSSLFYSNNNSLPLAVSKILDQAEAYHEAIPEEEQKLVRIRELFPNSPLEPLRRCLYATEGDIPKTVELYKVLEDIHARDGTPLAHGLLLQAKPYRQKPTALAAAPAAQHLAQQMPSSPALHRTRSDRPPTAQECLLIANTIRSRRDDAYRSAARTWRGKSALGNSGVAAYWADHARQLDREARQWELKAARETVEERRKIARSAQAIDLHGLTASQALTVTNETLNSWWHNPSAPASLTIVTGAGKHSAGQAPVLLPVVRKLLEREGYDWKYEGDRFNRGSVIVTGLQGRRKTSGW